MSRARAVAEAEAAAWAEVEGDEPAAYFRRLQRLRPLDEVDVNKGAVLQVRTGDGWTSDRAVLAVAAGQAMAQVGAEKAANRARQRAAKATREAGQVDGQAAA